MRSPDISCRIYMQTWAAWAFTRKERDAGNKNTISYGSSCAKRYMWVVCRKTKSRYRRWMIMMA